MLRGSPSTLTPRAELRRMTEMTSILRPQGYIHVLAYRREDLTPEWSMALRCRKLAKDTLQFNATLFANFSAAMADATQVGVNTMFTINARQRRQDKPRGGEFPFQLG